MRQMFFRAFGFMFIFGIIFTVLTLIYLPKRNCEDSQSAQVAGFFEEPKNTLDVLFLGSCNMYSSVSPLLIYEQYGITGYAMCCPDQELSTSYYYLKEAIKRQNLKAVVVESLFLTNTNGEKREYYNRFAVDSLPLSINKIALSWNISKRESLLMREYDQSAPGTLMTFVGYLFPLLRYHSRTDLTKGDLAIFHDQYNFYKGGFPQYNYTTNDGLYWDKVFNGDEINEVSQKYVPMIKQLCDDNNIQMIIVKSPNYARWGYDDEHTQIVREFAKSVSVPFIDFHSAENDNFEEWDYGYETGRLNIYGVKKFSETIGRYLTEMMGLQPTQLTPKDKALWDECLAKYYRVAEEKKCSISPGQIAQICNRDGAIRVRWNLYSDCENYSVYRCKGKNGNFSLIANKVNDVVFYDESVTSGQGYSYYVVANEGTHAGEPSGIDYYVYLDMPKNFQVTNDDGSLKLRWENVKEAQKYRIQRRTAGSFNFNSYDVTTEDEYKNRSVSDGVLYYYRIAAQYQEDGITYYSMTSVARAIPLHDPIINSVSSTPDSASIYWDNIEGDERVQVLRRREDENIYEIIAILESDVKTYRDEDLVSGLQYFYKIYIEKEAYDFVERSAESNTVGVKVGH